MLAKRNLYLVLPLLPLAVMALLIPVQVQVPSGGRVLNLRLRLTARNLRVQPTIH